MRITDCKLDAALSLDESGRTSHNLLGRLHNQRSHVMLTNSALLEGFEHHKAGRLAAAEKLYRQVLVETPNHAEALHLLGLIALQTGGPDDAIRLITRAIQAGGDRSDFHNNLGNAYKDQANYPAAAAAYRRALELLPNNPAILANLGNVLHLNNDVLGAMLCFEQALQFKPSDPATHFNLGNILFERRNLTQAANHFTRALALNPSFAGAHNNLGNVLKEQGRINEAAAAYERALQLDPNNTIIHANLGHIFQIQGNLSAAAKLYRHALQSNPDSAEHHNNLGAVLQDQRQLDEAIACYRKAAQLQPGDAKAASNVLVALQYRADVTPAELAAAHAEYERLHAAPLQARWHFFAGDRTPDRPLTIGFISPSFCQHPVGHFVIGAVENLDRRQFQVACYSDCLVPDAWTNRFQAASAIWRETAGLTDAELADQIRADQVDILFDLAGHTAKNRLLVCASKPAPIQITWADYVGTTGLSAIDYLLADAYEVPLTAEAFYSERVLRMPNGYISYEAPSYAPAVSELPATKQGFITFGSFNYQPKITSRTLEAWAAILRQVPNSRLLLKYRGMNDPSVVDGLHFEFSARGVEINRVECLGWSPHAQLLAEYQRVDIALDTYPYNGGLTTCEALWMGVPVITCPGETFASRHSLSHLSNAGLKELFARDLNQYVHLAVSLARDLPRLQSLRSQLRSRLAASPLCNARQFATDLGRILRDVWRKKWQNVNP